MKERYLHSVRALMDCPDQERERLLVRLDHALTAYLEDVPDADETNIIANFGTPEDCAAHLMEECTPGMVAAARQKKKNRHRISVTILGVLLAIAVGIVVYLWSNGGLVIVQFGNSVPESIRNQPNNTVVYNYDN